MEQHHVTRRGVGVLMSGLDHERAVLAGIQLGPMQACLRSALEWKSVTGWWLLSSL